jgi:hypothetical protein
MDMGMGTLALNEAKNIGVTIISNKIIKLP